MSINKDLEYYMSLKYPYKIEVLEHGGFFISYPDLPFCVSDGKTIEDALRMGEDARRVWTEGHLEMGNEIPEPFSSEKEYSGRVTLRMPKSLHKLLAQLAEKEEDVSLNQFIVYLLSASVGFKLKGKKNPKI